MTYSPPPYPFIHPTRHFVTLVNSYSLTKLGSHSRSPINHLPHSEKELAGCSLLHLHLFLIAELRLYSTIIGIQEIYI